MPQQPTDATRLALRNYPAGRVPLIEQQWQNLLFLHWEYDASVIQKTLPPGLYVDQYQGKAYVGITPFWMDHVKLKFLPAIPGASSFFEINLRTYVYDEAGTPGVWFYSLDANHFVAVQAAKTFFYLPYRHATIHSTINEQQQIEYSCQPDQTQVILNYHYQGKEPFKPAEPGTLDFFLVERYMLFALKEQRLACGRVYHAPYKLCQPQVLQWDDRLFEVDGLPRPQRAPDHMLFSPGVDVEVFSLENTPL
jgi:uncharacterized protein YqjF (DUF2071 family)